MIGAMTVRRLSPRARIIREPGLTATRPEPAATHRPYNAVEERAQVDLRTVQDDWQAALAALLIEWTRLSGDLRDEVAAQIRDAARADDPAAFAAITVPTAAAAAMLAPAMAALAGTAAGRVVDEAAAQDVTIEPVAPAEASFTPAASGVAGLVVGGYTIAGVREGLRRFGYDPDPDRVADAATTYLAGLSDAAPRAQFGGALTWAQNAGRLATLDAAPAATWYASERLDTNTCGPCRKIDGSRLPTLEAAQLAYGGGGYLLCEGTVRCRGTMIAVWE